MALQKIDVNFDKIHNFFITLDYNDFDTTVFSIRTNIKQNLERLDTIKRTIDGATTRFKRNYMEYERLDDPLYSDVKRSIARNISEGNSVVNNISLLEIKLRNFDSYIRNFSNLKGQNTVNLTKLEKYTIENLQNCNKSIEITGNVINNYIKQNQSPIIKQNVHTLHQLPTV